VLGKLGPDRSTWGRLGHQGQALVGAVEVDRVDDLAEWMADAGPSEILSLYPLAWTFKETMVVAQVEAAILPKADSTLCQMLEKTAPASTGPLLHPEILVAVAPVLLGGAAGQGRFLLAVAVHSADPSRTAGLSVLAKDLGGNPDFSHLPYAAAVFDQYPYEPEILK
jgi:hypothetical protein